MIVYSPNLYKSQIMCNKAADNFLTALKFISDWFVTSKILKNFDNSLYANDDILSYNENFDKVTFIVNQRHILAADLDKISLGNDKQF